VTRKVSDGAAEEVRFWHLNRLNTAPIEAPASSVTVNIDASASGIAVTGTRDIAKPLNDQQAGTSSTERELLAAVWAIEELGPELSGRTVTVRTDSFAAARNLVKGGGPKAHLNALVKKWWSACDTHNITARVEWVPRELNRAADKLSKTWADWWRLKPSVLRALQKEGKSDIINTPFGVIGEKLTEIATRGRGRQWMVVPDWQTTWWPKLSSLGSALPVPRAGVRSSHSA